MTFSSLSTMNKLCTEFDYLAKLCKIIMMSMRRGRNTVRMKTNALNFVARQSDIFSAKNIKTTPISHKLLKNMMGSKVPLWRVWSTMGTVNMGTPIRLKVGAFLVKRKGLAEHALRFLIANLIHKHSIDKRKNYQSLKSIPCLVDGIWAFGRSSTVSAKLGAFSRL